MSKRWYIAGPMTGYDELNYPAFEWAVQQLRKIGCQVCSPHELNPQEGRTWQECMVVDIKEMLDCDGILTLDGWEKSKGATLEVHIATQLEKPVMPLAKYLEGHDDSKVG